MADWLIRPASSLDAVPWRNGLGLTRDVVTVLHPDGSLRWQVSIADLVQDAPFSHFPHCDRVFTPIAGEPPPELAFDGGAFEPCPLLVPRRFSGEVPTLSRIPVRGRAFNAVADRRFHAAAVTVLHLVAGEAVDVPDAGSVVLHCLRGHLSLGGAALDEGDSAVGPGQARVAATRDGIALLVAIRPA